MKSTKGTARGDPKIEKLTKYLIDIIKSHGVPYTVRNSSSKTSNSKYILFTARHHQHTIRVSDHAPPYRCDSKKFFYDLRYFNFREGKHILASLFEKRKTGNGQAPNWMNNLRNITDLYDFYLERQTDPSDYQRWTNFFYTLNAIPADQKLKLNQMTFPEVMVKFKLPKEIPAWINSILKKYC